MHILGTLTTDIYDNHLNYIVGRLTTTSELQNGNSHLLTH